jgi:hypothetical protein
MKGNWHEMVDISAEDILRFLHILLRSRSVTKRIDLTSTTARDLGDWGKNDFGNGEGGSVIEGDDDGRRWAGGWR